MNFEEWLVIGMRKEWCGPPVCVPHDGIPTTEGEDAMMEEGDDPCIHILRLYPDDETARAVAENHSPTIWRASERTATATPEEPPRAYT